jgi:CHAT domain-containing protein
MLQKLIIKFCAYTILLCCSLIAPYVFAAQGNEDVDVENIKAPPRDVKDILRLLEQAKRDITQMEKAEKIASLPIPATQNNEELNAFYSRRAKANQDLGAMNQAIADIRMVVETYPASDPLLYLGDLVDLGVYENFGGNNTESIKAFERAKDWQTSRLPNNTGWQLAIRRQLVNAYSIAGNFDEAKKELDAQKNLFDKLRNSRNFSTYGSIWESQYESARGIYFLNQGQWVESERALRRAIYLLEEDYQRIKGSAKKVDPLDQVVRVYSDATTNPRGHITQIISRQLNLSSSLLQQRKLMDAEFYARKATQFALDSFGKSSTDVGRCLFVLSRVINEQGRSAEALLLAQAGLKSVQEAGVASNSITLANARRAYGNALVADGKYELANKVFNEMALGIKSDLELAKNFKTEDLSWVLALLKIKKFDQAQQMTANLLMKSTNNANKDSSFVAMIKAFNASALHLKGNNTEAISEFKVSIPILLNQARNDSENATQSIGQTQRLSFVLEEYLSALAQLAKMDTSGSAAAEAFQIADFARGSGVQRALTSSAARANISDPKLASLARSEQDLQQRINTLSELLTGLLSSPPEQQMPTVQAKIRTDIGNYKSQREELKKEIERKFPDYAELVEPKPASVERTQKLIKSDEVLVAWYFEEKVGYVWAITKDSSVQFAQLPIGKAQIAKDVSELRKALDPGVATIDEIPAFDVILANQVYQKILAPVQGALVGKKVMLTVPHAELGQLPLSLLVTKPVVQPVKGGLTLFSGYKNIPWLTRDIAVSQIPSVTALTALRSLPPGKVNRENFIGFGDPYFSAQQQKTAEKQTKVTQLATRGIPLNLRSAPKTSGVSSAELALLPSLPDTSIELEEIGKAIGARSGDIYLHQQASVKQVMSMDLSNRKVVMFATHGLVPGELDGLTQPALALSSPDVTGDKDDGLLTMDKVLTLKLDADWVVLSACNTAAGEGAGSEAVSGLGRAFFFAGAKALLVSNWPVDSVASRRMMTDLFRTQQKASNTSKAELLRQAMLSQIDQGGVKDGDNMKYAYAHPLFWAPFVVVGD